MSKTDTTDDDDTPDEAAVKIVATFCADWDDRKKSDLTLAIATAISNWGNLCGELGSHED